MPDQADADLIFARRNAAPALSATSDMPSIVEERRLKPSNRRSDPGRDPQNDHRSYHQRERICPRVSPSLMHNLWLARLSLCRRSGG